MNIRASLKRIYGRLPAGLRSRLRPLRRPAAAAFSIALRRATRGRTFSGPFAGLRHLAHCHQPYLTGTHERELHDWIETLCARSFERVVNVGAAGGYYAVGFALRLPAARVVAFETVPAAREIVADVARANGVLDHVELLGECTTATLDTAVPADGTRTLVVMDVEGAEMTLLDPDRASGLRSATILVEVHDVFAPGCSADIRARFARTHEVAERPWVQRTLDDWPLGLMPLLRRAMPRQALLAIDELRLAPMTWMLLTPRS